MKTYLSESVAVSFSGRGDDNLLSPVLSVEVFQVLLDGLQPGKFSREVNGCDTRVVGVPVQLFLQSLVDLVQRAQEELRRRRCWWSEVLLGNVKQIQSVSGGAAHLILLQGDLTPLEAQHQLRVLRPDVTVLRHLFDLL